MIYFTKPSITDLEKEFLLDALDNGCLSGDKKYTKLCTEWFNKKGINNFLLTTSGSSALELAAILSKIQPSVTLLCCVALFRNSPKLTLAL